MANEKRLIDANALKEAFDDRYDTAFVQERTRENKEFWNGLCAGVNWGRNVIADFPTVDAVRWISVKDRLPECFRYVLLWDSADRDCYMGVLRDNGEWYVPGYEDEPFNITHWMPLPEPPK